MDLRRLLRRHREFMALSALLLALLYTEEAFALLHLWPHRTREQDLLFLVVIAAAALVGSALAFFLPLRWANPAQHPRAWGVVAAAMGQSALITLALNGLILLLYLALVDFDLNAAATILKDVYLFTLITVVLFHGLLLYVRYMHYLYFTFGGSDTPAKPIAATGGLGAIILFVGLYLFGFDIQAVNNAPPALYAIVSLHVYARDLYLFSLALFAYAWHLRWIADH